MNAAYRPDYDAIAEGFDALGSGFHDYALALTESSLAQEKLIGLVDADKCARRNRLAALRFGVNTVTLAKSRAVPKGFARIDFARGSLPSTPDEALSKINALLPADATPLKAEDVLILPLMEAANNNFVGDRHLFIGSSTLKNIQREAELGFAFMNSHRTGSVSTPSEQPFGKTFAARYERYPSQDPAQRPFERTLLMTYMLRGVRPNGDSGPTTDDLFASIVGGTAPDVSMGINGGSAMCDVCGYELRSENCGHAPGTMRNVTPEQSTVQKRRGVPKGFASYTLEDGHAQEVSAVYSGAVPGAGFSKTYDYAKHGLLSRGELTQMASSYPTLLAKGEFGMNLDPENLEEVKESLAESIANKLKGFFGINTTQPQLGYTGTTYAANNPSGVGWKIRLGEAFTPTEEVTLLQPIDSRIEELEKQNEAYQKQLADIAQAEKLESAEKLVSTFLSDNHLLPAGRNAAVALATLLSDLPGTVAFADATGAQRALSPIQLFEKVMQDVPQHGLLTDHEFTDLPKDAVLLRGEVGDTDDTVLEEVKADVQAATSNKNGHKKTGRS